MLFLITMAFFAVIVSFMIPTSMAEVYAEIDKKEKEIVKYQIDENQVIDNNKDSSMSSNSNIAVVFPTFTMAAYNQSFYQFYGKYEYIVKEFGETGKREYVTSDLNLLTSLEIPKTNFFDIKSLGLWFLANHISEISPNTNISYLTDTDIHNGLIFNPNHQNNYNVMVQNKYNVLILGHQEYVTQQEYNNFKKFVENGGILILLDANTFYAEVDYDPVNNKITLVKGHYFAFDGQRAWSDVGERWWVENTEWVGSNYCSCPVTFNNNPFQYNPHEENHITNPNAKILLDYGAKSYTDPKFNKTIGVYELEYKLGKVISFGIFGDSVVSNKNFLKFFDTLLIDNNIIRDPIQQQQIKEQPIQQLQQIQQQQPIQQLQQIQQQQPIQQLQQRQ
jgi:hypothetical protein